MLAIKLDLAELDAFVFGPLCRSDLAHQLPEPGVLCRACLLADQVPDQVPAGEHLCIGPFGVRRCRIDQCVERLTPDAGHFQPEPLRVPVEFRVEPVEGSRLSPAGAGNIGHEDVLAGSFLGAAPDVFRFPPDLSIKPGNRVFPLACHRPFHLVDEPPGKVDPITAAVSLSQGQRPELRKSQDEQRADELLEVMVTQTLVEVLMAALRHGPSFLTALASGLHRRGDTYRRKVITTLRCQPLASSWLRSCS